MKKFFMFFAILFVSSLLFAENVTITLKNGKTVSGKIVKIEAAQIGSKSLAETTTISAAQGVNELMLKFSDIKEIDFKSSDDVSCFEDGRFVPVRKFCSMKALYHIVPKVKGESKEPVEIEDNRVFFIHIEGEKTPVAAFFYKIQVSNEGNESKKDYPDLEREVLELSKNNIKKIVFK
ncbi:hypothetical protein J6253_02365 [bacterium]|nr:hypothetical protein [bacterium]MBP5591578.1 hypothetical protein [bacterium]